MIINIIESLIVIVPSLLVVAYVTIAERKTMASMQRRLGPIKWCRILLFWAKLPNSEKLLKLRVLVNKLNLQINKNINFFKVTILKMIEREMDNCGSKLTYKVIKEQRVDGNWYGVKPNLRCTLTDFERNYQVKVLSNQINNKYYSTTACSNIDGNSLDPWFITGFCDAEASFMILILREPKNKTGWTVKARFSIGLHEKDKAILESINNYLGNIGSISKQGKHSVQYRVSSLYSITNILIPFFEKYPLITQKQADFLLFKKAVNLMNNKEHLTISGIDKLVAIKGNLNLGLSDELKLAFPKVVPIQRPLVKNQLIKDPNWLAGFSSGEGCFNVRLKKLDNSLLGLQTILTFKLTQHSRDKELIESIVEYLNCGKVYKDYDSVNYIVTKFTDLTDKLIPFFDKYEIIGIKNLDYVDFKKVVKLMQNKDHLTESGLNKIRIIKDGMNKGRKE